MKLRIILIVGLFVLALAVPKTANAQNVSPESQALGNKLLAEINAGIQCNAQAIALKQQLDAANAKLKEFTEHVKSKTESAPDASQK